MGCRPMKMASTDDTTSSLEHSTTDLDLEMADEIKKDQGFHECEVSTSTDPTQAEADLHKQYAKCTKNPGHKDFIPVKKFNIKHIPNTNSYRDIVLFNFFRVMINLTVKIHCTFTSMERPKTFPGTNKQYPYYNHRGKEYGRNGTGMVRHVENWTNKKKRKRGKEGKTCPCIQCKDSPTPMTQWYEVVVYTAIHVVFDSIEAQHTTCQLFYDSDKEKNKIQELKGETAWCNGNITYDMCLMECYIHDLKLGKKLDEMWKGFHNLSDKMMDIFRNSAIEHPLTVIVSHPHGCSKQVTIGEMKLKKKVDDDSIRYTYTTPTCSGSSGAPVYVVGRYGRFPYGFPSHSQGLKSGLNMSVTWYG